MSVVLIPIWWRVLLLWRRLKQLLWHLLTHFWLFWHLLCCGYWAAEYEWPSSDTPVWRTTGGPNPGCYREPRYVLQTDIYSTVGKNDEAFLHGALGEVSDFSKIDDDVLRQSVSLLAGGAYMAASEEVFDGGAWDDALQLVPPALFAEFSLNATKDYNVALIPECNG